MCQNIVNNLEIVFDSWMSQNQTHIVLFPFLCWVKLEFVELINWSLDKVIVDASNSVDLHEWNYS